MNQLFHQFHVTAYEAVVCLLLCELRLQNARESSARMQLAQRHQRWLDCAPTCIIQLSIMTVNVQAAAGASNSSNPSVSQALGIRLQRVVNSSHRIKALISQLQEQTANKSLPNFLVHICFVVACVVIHKGLKSIDVTLLSLTAPRAACTTWNTHPSYCRSVPLGQNFTGTLLKCWYHSIGNWLRYNLATGSFFTQWNFVADF